MNDPSPLHSLFVRTSTRSTGALQAARAALGSLPMVARALLSQARKPMRIVVDARASTGSTDCETIVRLPALPLPVNDDDVDSALELCGLTYGLLHHEVGHCNHSDIALFRAARRGLEQELLNIIEDVRMELAHIRDLPASRRYLDAMNYVMKLQGKWAIVPTGQTPPAVFISYVLTRLNALYRQDPETQVVHDETRVVMESTFSPEFTQKLDDLLAETPNLQSCRDSFDLARKVVELLQQERDAAQSPPPESAPPEDGDPQPPAGSSDPDQVADPSDAANSSAGDSSDQSTPSGPASDDAQQNEGGEATDPGQSEDEGEADASTGSGRDDQQPADADDTPGNGQASDSKGDSRPDDDLAQPSDDGTSPGEQDDATGEQTGQASGNSGDTPSGSEGASSGSGTTRATGGQHDSSTAPPADRSLADALDQVLATDDDHATDRHEQARQMLNDLTEALAQHLYEALDLERAMEELEDSNGLGGRDDSSGALHLGAKHDLDKGYSVALDIRRKLLSELDALTNADVSIGRKGNRLSARHLDRVISGDPRVFRSKSEAIAPSTAIMLCEDVSTSMAGEPVQIASQALYASAIALEGMEGIEVAAMAFPGNGKIIGFGESPKFRQDRFQLQAWGGTPMADAVLVATQALLQQDKARRIMIVLTDGEPAEPQLTLAHIASAQANGIELFGVGIKTDSVKRYFPRWISIDDVSQLPARLVALVRDEVILSLAA